MGLYKFKKVNNEKVLIFDNTKIKVLIDEVKLCKRVKELGREITRDYKGKNPVVFSLSAYRGGKIYPPSSRFLFLSEV